MTGSVASQRVFHPNAARLSFASVRSPADRPGKDGTAIVPFKHYVKNIHSNFFGVHLGYRIRRKRDPAFFNNPGEYIGESDFFLTSGTGTRVAQERLTIISE